MKPSLVVLIPAALAAAIALAPRSARAQATTGLVAFEAKCASCHQTAGSAVLMSRCKVPSTPAGQWGHEAPATL